MATQNQFSAGSAQSGGQSGSATDHLSKKAAEARDSLQEVGQAAREAAQEKMQQVRDVAQERVGELRDRAGEYYEMGRERAYDLEQSLEQRIRERPLNSVLMAAGVGILLGILWRR